MIFFTLFLLSFIFSILGFPAFIKFLNKYSGLQPIYELAPLAHQQKIGIPTLGGAVILAASFLSLIFFNDLLEESYLVIIFAMGSYALIGLLDDTAKIKRKKNQALTVKNKLLLQIIFASLTVYLIAYKFNSLIELAGIESLKGRILEEVTLYNSVKINLGSFYYIFAVFLIVASANAVNLTDGLDGLAALPLLLILGSFFCIALNQLSGVNNEIALIIAAVSGALLGFLWFNAKPAQIFMGDIGSMSLGALIGTLAILLKIEILLPVFALVFVIETLTVILQVIYFRLTKGKRLLKMAPWHHHLELSSWAEEKIVARFFIISIVAAAFGLALYKFGGF